MEFISHRVNKVNELLTLSSEYGVEIDLRDALDGHIYMEHDPFTDGEDFENYLKNYKNGTIILNVKSERIEHRILEMLKQYGISEYFFLDSSFPMIKTLTDLGERKIALRYSEFEGIDTIENMKGKVDWIWVDCFTKFPLDKDTYLKFKEWGFKLCMVSPELQGQPERIEEYAKIMVDQGMEFDAICTKEYNIEKWKTCLA